METNTRYKNYPFKTVLLSNLVTFGIYSLGFFIIFNAGLIFSIIYLIFILLLEYRLIRYHCTNCCYWSKICGFGRGKVSSILFKKGDTSKFNLKKLTWKDLIPDFLVPLIPIVVGIILLILNFNLSLLAAIVAIIALSTTGNAYIRGQLTCGHCKQQKAGCLAEALFREGN